MQKIIGFILLNLIHFVVQAQLNGGTQYVVYNWDSSVLEKLLSGKYSSKMNLTKWKPFPGERTLISDDGFCYSNQDTVLFYADASGKHAVLVYSTKRVSGEIVEDCASCNVVLGMAKFDFIDEKWFLVSNNRTVNFMGQSSQLPKPRIIKIGENNFALALREDTFQDVGIEFIYQLSENHFSELVFSYYHSNLTMNENGSIYSENNVRFIENGTPWFGVELESNVVKTEDIGEVSGKSVKYFHIEEFTPLINGRLDLVQTEMHN
jgi:hypothetical protein